MKGILIILVLLSLGGCANNPLANSQMLARTSLYEPLFLASTASIPDKVEFKSLAIMYEQKIPAVFLPSEHLVITEKGVFLSEWQPSSYIFKHKLKIPFSEITSVSNTVVERQFWSNSEHLEIRVKSGDVFKFLLLDNGSNFAKSLIMARLHPHISKG